MHLIQFIVLLLIVGFIFGYIFSIGVGPIIMLLGKTENKIVIYGLMGVALIIQTFLILGWDAYTVSKTLIVMNGEGVTQPWIYVVVGFFGTVASLFYMVANEPRDAGGPGLGSCIFLTLSIIGFWVFFLYPPLMLVLYGWFLNWWFK